MQQAWQSFNVVILLKEKTTWIAVFDCNFNKKKTFDAKDWFFATREDPPCSMKKYINYASKSGFYI